MKYLLLLLLFTSCELSQKPIREVQPLNKDIISNVEFYIIILDSCEYIYMSGYGRGGLAHKGNCKNH